MDSPHALKDLFQRYLNNTCTTEELDLLIRFFGTTDEDVLKDLIRNIFERPESEQVTNYDTRLYSIYQKIQAEIDRNESKQSPTVIAMPRKTWLRAAMTAAALVAISVGAYYLSYKKAPVKELSKNVPKDIGPGGNKAILILGDGKKISLTDAKMGNLLKQGGSLVTKSAEGEVVYSKDQSPSSSRVAIYNMIETPRGGKFTIALPDGSVAWLDAASSVRFPTVFKSTVREVEITGQVYFEVVHDAAKPFRVSVRRQTIEVLGTHFNVSSYGDDEAIRATLLEGRIRLINTRSSVILYPGQQAAVNNDDKILISNVDTDEAVAWKNGYFVFDNEDIHSIMRKLERWYNIDVEYATGVPQTGFGGMISRSKNISEVLKALQLTKAVHFKIEGRRVTVMP